MPHILEHPDRSYTLITHDVCAFFDALVDQCRGRVERGGILIGGRRGPHIDVVKTTFPAGKDRATYYSFRRVDPTHQRIADRAWRSAHGTLSYVGEWHSHPHGAIVPSSTDLETWQTVVASQRTRCAFVLVTPEGWGVFDATPMQKVTPKMLDRFESGGTGVVFG